MRDNYITIRVSEKEAEQIKSLGKGRTADYIRHRALSPVPNEWLDFGETLLQTTDLFDIMNALGPNHVRRSDSLLELMDKPQKNEEPITRFPVDGYGNARS